MVAPIVADTTKAKVPTHLPNIKPANKAKGVQKPKKIIQMMVKKEKTIRSKNVFSNLKLFNNCWLFLMKLISVKSLISKFEKIMNIKAEKQMRYTVPRSNFNFKFICLF